LSWDIIFIVDSFHWADRLTCTTIHALIWLDIKHARAFINAINRALFAA
jgi:hypothetical protein